MYYGLMKKEAQIELFFHQTTNELTYEKTSINFTFLISTGHMHR